VPTPISHAAVGFAIAAWTQRATPSEGGRVCAVAAACAALPDIDVIGWLLHLSDASLFSHRAITHSLAFALVTAAVAAWTQRSNRLFVILGLALLSHGFLDALSTYSVGIAFLAPFSMERFRFLWTPLGSPNGALAGQLVQEAVVVLLPAVVLAWLGLKVRR
jgi:inner membrane protein